MTMKTIHDLCDIVRQTAYDIHVYHGNDRFQIRKYVMSQGRVTEEGLSKLSCLLPFIFAFFRG